MNIAEVVVTLVRQGIFRCFLLHEKGTVESVYQLNTDVLTAEDEIALKYMKVEPAGSSKTRQLTFISAPTNE